METNTLVSGRVTSNTASESGTVLRTALRSKASGWMTSAQIGCLRPSKWVANGEQRVTDYWSNNQTTIFNDRECGWRENGVYRDERCKYSQATEFQQQFCKQQQKSWRPCNTAFYKWSKHEINLSVAGNLPTERDLIWDWLVSQSNKLKLHIHEVRENRSQIMLRCAQSSRVRVSERPSRPKVTI